MSNWFAERLVMRASEGPFPMEASYTWADEPGGFGRLVAPFMARAMGAANREDLARLKALLEG